jgi:hypothetical protein
VEPRRWPPLVPDVARDSGPSLYRVAFEFRTAVERMVKRRRLGLGPRASVERDDDQWWGFEWGLRIAPVGPWDEPDPGLGSGVRLRPVPGAGGAGATAEPEPSREDIAAVGEVERAS